MATEKLYDVLKAAAARLPPPLLPTNHKGSCGRICVVGGSADYTGAPYFAGVSALRLGVDLATVYCSQEALTPIKCYSPDLMVGCTNAAAGCTGPLRPTVEEMSRFHGCLVGPGLGREEKALLNARRCMRAARELGIPLVVDADGIAALLYDGDAEDFNHGRRRDGGVMGSSLAVVAGYDRCLLTPNKVEMQRIAKAVAAAVGGAESAEDVAAALGVAILSKGPTDRVLWSGAEEVHSSISGCCAGGAEHEPDAEAVLMSGGSVVDPLSNMRGTHRVHGDRSTSYSATLVGQAKYYIIQVLEDVDNGHFVLWTRWGRTGGVAGQQQRDHPTAASALGAFRELFRDKTKNEWCDRENFSPVEHRYTLVQAAQEKLHRRRGVQSVDVVTDVAQCRRVGGQGDVLSGCCAAFAAWLMLAESELKTASGPMGMASCAVGASLVTRQASAMAFAAEGRGMLASELPRYVPKGLQCVLDAAADTSRRPI